NAVRRARNKPRPTLEMQGRMRRIGFEPLIRAVCERADVIRERVVGRPELRRSEMFHSSVVLPAWCARTASSAIGLVAFDLPIPGVCIESGVPGTETRLFLGRQRGNLLLQMLDLVHRRIIACRQGRRLHATTPPLPRASSLSATAAPARGAWLDCIVPMRRACSGCAPGAC